MTSPDYSPYARQYAESRPRYPAELFAYLATLVEPRHLAWDCATGNGQAALGLAGHFERVIATDRSAEQIRHAVRHPQIEYRVAHSERSELDERSTDLVTVAAALHWFDLERFHSEVRRVLRPGGVLAAWTYHVAHAEPPFGRVLGRFYREVLSPYFAPGARLVDERYETITLPGEPIERGEFYVSATWDLPRLHAFIRSWSGTQRYLQEQGEDPIALIAEELEDLWGESQSAHTLRWPLYLRIARL